jgi:hypothetical protein
MTTNVSQDVGKKLTFINGWWECKLVQPLLKTVWRLLKRVKVVLPCNSAMPFLGLYPKECESGYNKGTCTPMFIAALYKITKLWKQPRYLMTEWIKKMWHLYTKEFYSVKEE